MGLWFGSRFGSGWLVIKVRVRGWIRVRVRVGVMARVKVRVRVIVWI